MPKVKQKSAPPTPPPIISLGHLRIDRDHAIVTVGDRDVHLSPKQNRLLWTLMAHPNQVLSRATLMQEVWETDYTEDTRTLEVHIHWLRHKIEPNPARPVYLLTVRGQGYIFLSQSK
jgi:DNA-binding response OmpR family regulator